MSDKDSKAQARTDFTTALVVAAMTKDAGRMAVAIVALLDKTDAAEDFRYRLDDDEYDEWNRPLAKLFGTEAIVAAVSGDRLPTNKVYEYSPDDGVFWIVDKGDAAVPAQQV